VRSNRIIDAGWLLSEIVGPKRDSLYAHLRREALICDGHTGDSGEPSVSTSRNASVTERAAMQLYDIRNLEQDLNYLEGEMLLAIRHYAEHQQKVERFRAGGVAPTKPSGMCDQTGKEGAIEWGDPLCPMPAVKGGMCQAHYTAWYRHRKANGIDTSKDYEPA